MKKHIIYFLICCLAALSVHGQYTPKVSSYGNWYNRLKPDSAQHLPHKYALTLNDNDTTPQIFAWSTALGDSLVTYINGRYHIQGVGGGSTYNADETSIHLAGTTFGIKSTWTGQSSITTVGTLVSGIWNSTAIADPYIASSSTWNAKQTSVLTSAKIWIGNGSNVAQERVPSGDWTIDNLGVATLANVVTAGTCTNCDLTIDAKGRVTSKANGTGGGGGSPPYADNTALVKNNADNTRLLILSAAAIATATTRTWTFPDVNGTVARNDAAQTFTGVQTFASAPNLSSLTATRPLKLDGSKNIISAQIALNSANDVTGQLPFANIANVSDNRLTGNFSGGVTTMQEISLGVGLQKTGTNQIGVIPDTLHFYNGLSPNLAGDSVKLGGKPLVQHTHISGSNLYNLFLDSAYLAVTDTSNGVFGFYKGDRIAYFNTSTSANVGITFTKAAVGGIQEGGFAIGGQNAAGTHAQGFLSLPDSASFYFTGPTPSARFTFRNDGSATMFPLPHKTIAANDSVIVANGAGDLFKVPQSAIGGGGSGSTNLNIGSGYRWAVPTTNNIKTFFSDGTLTLDSTTNTNAITAVVLHPNLEQTTTVSGNTSLTIASGEILEYILVDPTSLTTNFQVGTTSTGSDLVPTQNLGALTKNLFVPTYRATASTTIYFQNISSSTVITIKTRK